MDRKFEILEAVRLGRMSPEHAALELKKLTSPVKYYSCRWETNPLKQNSKPVTSCLILCDQPKAITVTDSIYVYRGARFEIISANEISINPASSEDYETLFAYLQENNHKCGTVIHLWNLTQLKPELAELSYSGLSVLNLCKQIIRCRPSEITQFLFVYQQRKGEKQPAFEAVSAIFKSIEEETTKICGQTIAIDQGARNELMQVLEQEIAGQWSGSVRYADGLRMIKKYVPLTLGGGVPLVRPQENYLVAGGAGALGRILTKDLLENHAKVIWCGRKPSGEIGIIPPDVRYFQCDVSDRSQLVDLKETLQQNHIEIKGIILCSGSVEDERLEHKKIRSDSRVFLSKITAVQLLDQVFQDALLEFFILYSSMVSAVSCMGQSDYAYANAFLNCFAEYRNMLKLQGKRSGTTISIAWPYFVDGGMKTNQAALTFIKEAKGILPIKASLQYELISKALQADKDYVFIVNSGAEAVFESNRPIKKAVNTEQVSAAFDGGVLDFLKQEASAILNESKRQFDDNGKFSKYGFDSITSIEFTNSINKFYKIKMLPSVLYEYTRFDTLAGYLTEKYPDQIGAKHGTRNTCCQPNTDSGFGQKPKNDAVAIVGMAGRFPKSRNTTEFWHALNTQESLIEKIPAQRWNWEDYYDETSLEKNRTSVIWGGFLDRVDQFDEKLFKITPKEAEYMNPQQRLLLENVWETIEDAGYRCSDLAGSNTGVFAGIAGNEYNDICVENKVEINAYSSMGLQHSIAANRISYFFDFKGPSEAVDTACSSSLVAMNRAVRAIRGGECDAAIVCGVNIILTPSLYIAFDKAGMLSKTGKCRAFDKDADGFVRGEGVASVYLKPLEKALQDQDQIYGIVRGCGVNHGGDASSLTSPNTSAQKELLVRTYREAGVDFSNVSYIETHGTGTIIGDSIEINALSAASQELYPNPANGGRCGLGSVKTNIGHLETAAGIAGMIKVLLSMKHGMIPGNAGFHELSPMVRLEETPFYIVDQTVTWNRSLNSDGSERPRIAGISSFGFGGTNAHVIIEEYLPSAYSHIPNAGQKKPVLIPVSAQTEQQLAGMIQNLIKYLRTNEKVDIRDVAFTLQNGRENFPVRYAVYGTSKEMIIEELERYPLAANPCGDNYQNLCRQFIGGEEINWAKYCENYGCRRISLPTYVFAPNRHWVKTVERQTGEENIFLLKRSWQREEDASPEKRKSLLMLVTGDEERRQYQEKSENHLRIVSHDTWEREIDNEFDLILDMRTAEMPVEFINMMIKICKRLLSQLADGKVGYILAYRIEDQKGYLNAASAESFFQALSREYPDFRYQIIGYETKLLDLDHLELTNSHIKYQDGSRFRLNVTSQIFHAKPYLQQSRLKEKGVYIIFGGNGGIGTVTAEFILEHTNSMVILAGRKEETDKASPIMERYRERVVYRRCDLTDLEDLKHLRDEILSGYHQINGLIHSAGLTIDKPFAQKTVAEFHQVISAKVQGLLNIDQVFEQDRLDFLLIYTSVAAYFGSGGQTDYCFGSRFAEEFANYRETLRKQWKRYGETLSIGWPYWKDMGMRMPESMVRQIQSKFGMLPITTEIGLSLLKTVFFTNVDSASFGYGQQVILPGVKKVLPKRNQLPSGGSLKEQLTNYIRNLFADLVGILSADLGADTTFESLGIDSLLTAQFTQLVQKDFGKVASTILYECTTINGVVCYLLEKHQAAVERYFYASDFTVNGQPAQCNLAEVTTESVSAPTGEEIAVIGYDGQYANADNPRILWDKLVKGEDMTSDVPKDRWDHKRYYSPNPDDSQNGKYYCRKAGFLNEPDVFDPLFFHISPKEAELMDPQERLLLTTAWNTVESAGYHKNRVSEIAENLVGVFTGVTTHTYNLRGNESFINGSGEIARSEAWSMANRISYFMNWKGPSLAVDTACSSSLAALHLACESLKRGECKMAFVGSANVYMHPTKFIYMSQMKMLSKSGVCSAFGEAADGFVPGEGVGGVLLKPLRQAEADGDRIYGIIKASALNHDGMTNGYTVPSVQEQSNVIKQAIQKAGIHPETISYLEAHGTGTSLGDPIEIAALNNAWAEYTDKKHFCAVGSVKANLGHSEACAGLAAVTKVLLQMEHQQLVPSIHSEVLNNRIEFNESPFYIQQKCAPWNRPVDELGGEIPRRAAVSSFGAGGTNVHVILEEYQKPKRSNLTDLKKEKYIFILSARNERQLKAYAGKVAAYLQVSNPDLSALEGKIKSILADVLSVSAEEIDQYEPLENYGMDRIQLYQLGKQLVNAFGNHERIAKVSSRQNLSSIIKEVLKCSPEHGVRLSDLIYTSHLRESFDQRLVVYCKTVEELADGLDAYLRGRDSDCYLTGNIKQYRDKKYDTEAEPEKLWVAGGTPAWEIQSDADLIDLPTYPFAKDRYIIDFHESDGNRLLDPELIKQVFTKEIRKTDSYVKDHKINGIETLPGVFYLQLIFEMAEKIVPGKNIVITNATWLKPIQLRSDSLTITVQFEQIKERYEFVIRTDQEIHMQGRVEVLKSRSEPIIQKLNTDKTRVQIINQDQCYDEFSARGFQYGAGFKGLQSIKWSDGNVMASVRLPDIWNDFEQYILHPGILDCAFQASIGISYAMNQRDQKTWIPFGFKQMNLWNHLESDCCVQIHNLRVQKEMRICDLAIFNTQGELLLTFDALTFRAFAAETTASSEHHLHYHQPIWVNAELNTSGKAKKETVLVFYHGEKLTGRIAEKYHLIYVRSGSSKNAEADEYFIRPDHDHDYEILLADLTDREIPVTKILYLWTAEQGEFHNNPWEAGFDSILDSMFFLCKALVSWMPKTELRLYFATVTKAGISNPHDAAVSGFLKSIHQEHGHILPHIVELEWGLNEQNLELLAAELSGTEKAIELRYDNGCRYVKQITQIQIELENGEDFATGRMVYLVTGALGGLAGYVIDMLCDLPGQSHLILTDLADSGEKSRLLINKIRDGGGQAVYLQADLTKADEVLELVQQGKKEFGQIDGIFHIAGIINDGRFEKKELETLKKVIAPKVWGTTNIDEATKNEPIRWFVLFSSLAAFGNAGQCDYAYANEFLVKFQELRNAQMNQKQRSGRTIAINWPLWNGGGMRTDKETEKLFRHFGMQPLDPKSGIKSLREIIGNYYPQVIVTKGDKNRIEEKLNSLCLLRATKDTEAVNEKEDVLCSFTQQMISFIQGILKVRDEIDITAEIREYGFDSVSITELANKINTLYHTSVLPTQAFEYQTISEFIEAVYRQNTQKINQFYPTTSVELPEVEEVVEVEVEVEAAEQIAAAPQDDLIAIIGMSGVLPGADDLDEFWDNLITKKDLITEIPEERWSSGQPDNTLVNKAAFMSSITDFDAELFGISNREAMYMDPVQRLVLEESYRALENAGLQRKDIDGTKSGVYIGLVSMEYYEKITSESEVIDPYLSTGNSRAVTANRLSYLYGLTGPSEVIDTACSSSIAAIERAIQDLKAGKCDMAITGGVNVILSPKVHSAYSRTGMLSPDGRCKTFDQAGDGYGRGEGCGIIILKPLSKAMKDRDFIHAVLLGAALNHTGRVNTLTTPSPIAQANVIEQAVMNAKIPYQSIGYIETHGTGTILGDPIEITGLKKAEEKLNNRKLPHPCVLGAVKTNIGHLEGAAGIAGVLKTILILQQGKIPANMNFKQLNEYIKIDDTGYMLADRIMDFPQIKDEHEHDYARRAGVSSFGFGGVNAHLILEEYTNHFHPIEDNQALHVFILSGRTSKLLRDYANKICDWLRNNQESLISDIGMQQAFIYTLQCLKEPCQHRLSMVFDTIPDLYGKLSGYLAGGNQGRGEGIYAGDISSGTKKEIKFTGMESANQLAHAVTIADKIDLSIFYNDCPDKIALMPRPLKKVRHWTTKRRTDLPIPVSEQEIWEKTCSDTEAEITDGANIKISADSMLRKQTFENSMAELEKLAALMLIGEFHQTGFFREENQEYQENVILQQLGVMPSYKRLFRELIDFLCRHKYLTKAKGQLIVTVKAEEALKKDLSALIQPFRQQHKAVSYHLQLLEHCLTSLMMVLNGKRSATDLLFPDSGMDLVKTIYADNWGADYYNELIAQAVIAHIKEIRQKDSKKQIKILEIGAGTGGTTKMVLAAIKEFEQGIQYVYTDISVAFLKYGETEYGKHHSFMNFQLLNIEMDLLKQGFEAEEYDLIIGSNVLHATRNMTQTIANLKSVLNPDGWIIVNEITKVQGFLTMTFGLTPGWWLFEDAAKRLPGSPLLDFEGWEAVFKETGFHKVTGLDTLLSNQAVSQDVIIAFHHQTFRPERVTEAEVQHQLMECLAEILMIDAGGMDISVPYSEYGVDSILSVECIQSINKKLNIQLKTTDLFNYPDVKKLSEHIISRYNEELLNNKNAKNYVWEQEISDLLDQYEQGNISLDKITEMLEMKNE